MALRDHQAGVPRQSAEDRDGVSYGVTDHVGMGCTTDIVENDAGESNRRIEASEAVDQRRRAAGHRPGVDHEDDGEVQQLGHLRRAPAVALPLAAVVEAHDAFDHRGIGVYGRRGESLPVDVGSEHPAVEVAGGTPARMRVMERVDEIGTDLERLHGQAATPQRSDQAQRDGRLADPAVGAADDDSAQRSGAHVTQTKPQATMRMMRIVSLLPSATDMIADLGLMDSLVGVSEDCNWPPEVASKPVVARTRIDVSGLTSAQIDQLVTASQSESHSLYAVDADLMSELRPDLVITQDLCEVCAVSSGDLKTACPIGVEVFSMNPRSFDDVVESVIALADKLGVHERGVAVAGAMNAKVDAVREAVAGRDRPRVFVAEWMDPPYGSGHWLPEMVEAAGGVNVLSKPGEFSFATTWETVLAEEPELIVMAACGFSLEQALERASDLRLPVRTVVVDGDAHFSRPALRIADGVRQLAHLIHPEVVEDPGLPYAELPLGVAYAG